MILGELDPDVCLDCGRHPSQCDCTGAGPRWVAARSPGMCLRWQELVVPTTGQERLRFSCACGGESCPFDPRPHRS